MRRSRDKNNNSAALTLNDRVAYNNSEMQKIAEKANLRFGSKAQVAESLTMPVRKQRPSVKRSNQAYASVGRQTPQDIPHKTTKSEAKLPTMTTFR